MEFFIRYANAIEQELNDDGSNIGDILVDWKSLTQKESTTNVNDTSEAVTEHTNRPKQDGNMPKRPFSPREVESNKVKLRDVWNTSNSKVSYSEPITLNAFQERGPTRIVRKKATRVGSVTIVRKSVREAKHDR